MEFLITNKFSPSFQLIKKYQHSKAKNDLKFPDFKTLNSQIHIRKSVYYKQKKIYYASVPFVYYFLPEIESTTECYSDYIEIGYFDPDVSELNGAGMRIYKNGEIYQGYFKDDLYHYYGRLIDCDGQVFEGRFEFGLKLDN